MIQITPQTKILLAIEPADFRRGIDGLARLCKEELKNDPFSGSLFVFRNRSATAIKALAYDGQGYWLFYKRLSKGRFSWWPENNAESAQRLDVRQLQFLLWNADPSEVSCSPFWKEVSA